MKQKGFTIQKRGAASAKVMLAPFALAILVMLVILVVRIPANGKAQRNLANIEQYQNALSAVCREQNGFAENLETLANQLNRKLDQNHKVIVDGTSLSTSLDDPWGTRYMLLLSAKPSSKCFTILSAGPDREYWTDDDAYASVEYNSEGSFVVVSNDRGDTARVDVGKNNGNQGGKEDGQDDHTHDWSEWNVVINATCLVDGTREHTCGLCGLTEYETIKATGHTEVVAPGTQPTCLATGTTERIYCSVCNAVIKESDVLPTVEHNFETVNVIKQATCTEGGLIEVRCGTCGTEERLTTGRLNHAYGQYVIQAGATCNSNYTKTKTCIRCKGTISTTVVSDGHVPVDIPPVKATCTTPGQTGGTECAVCGKVLEQPTIINAGNHDFVFQTPPCKSSGSTHAICSLCGYETYMSLPVTYQHNWINGLGKCADCGLECFDINGIMTLDDRVYMLDHLYYDRDGIMCYEVDGVGDLPEYSESQVAFSRYRSRIGRIVISKGITFIPRILFENCVSVTEVCIPDTVQRIDIEAFKGCTNLKKIIYSGTMEMWEKMSKHENWDEDLTKYTVYTADGKSVEIKHETTKK